MRTTTMPWTAELMEMLRASETQEPDFARWGLLHSAGEWGRPRGLQFHLHALLHPINLTALILACCAAMITGAAWLIPLAVGVDALLVHGVARLRPFRHAVDSALDSADRGRQRNYLAGLMASMSPGHRARFEELLRRRDSMVRSGGAAHEFVEERLRPNRLLAHYVRLTLIHRQWSSVQQTTDRDALQAELERLEAGRAVADSAAVQQVLAQREHVLRSRAEEWDRTQERLRVVEHQLELVVEIMAVLEAQVATMASAEDTAEEIGSCLEELALHESTIRGLAALDDVPLEGHRSADRTAGCAQCREPASAGPDRPGDPLPGTPTGAPCPAAAGALAGPRGVTGGQLSPYLLDGLLRDSLDPRLPRREREAPAASGPADPALTHGEAPVDQQPAQGR